MCYLIYFSTLDLCIGLWYNYSMIDESVPIHKRICPAMKAAGIDNPDSAEGIRFCAGDKDTESSCPYPKCIVFEYSGSELMRMETDKRIRIAKEYKKYGVSTKDIALIMGLSNHTVRSYLKR